MCEWFGRLSSQSGVRFSFTFPGLPGLSVARRLEEPAAERIRIGGKGFRQSIRSVRAMRESKQMKLPNIFEKEVTPQSFSAGSVIFGEGEHGDSMYVVKSGEVNIYIRDQLVETVGADGFFGEVVLVDHVARSGTAVAKTDCTLIPINERHFMFMVQETPFFALAVLRAMSSRLRRQNEITAG
jgi:CRP/FNR family cyclic AMP-dependent transcriptional regulator